jgi:hypothetical protein
MESHRLSTQRIMCIFSLLKNFLLYAQVLHRQPHHHEQTLTYLSQVLFFSLTCAKWKLIPNSSWTAFPASRTRPRDLMAWLASVSIRRRVYQNGQQQYAQFRIKRWIVNCVYDDIQKLGVSYESVSSSWWRALQQMLTCTSPNSAQKKQFVDIPQGLRSTRKLDRCILSNPRWLDEFAKYRGKRLR